MKDELVAEWKRYLESDEFLHSPECGTLLIARHFAEWGRRHNEQKTIKKAMATIKSYTDISQSKKLAEILPLESADMHFVNNKHAGCVPYLEMTKGSNPWLKGTDISACWSLAALLEILPKFITKYVESERCQKTFHLNFFRSYYHCISYSFTPSVNENDNTLYCIGRDNWIDACYEMILKLHELNMLQS